MRRDGALLRYVESLNSGAEDNFNHTTHLFGKVYDVGAEKWRDLLSSKHVTGGLSLKSDALYGPYICGLTKQKLATLQDCESFLASVISASQSFSASFHAIVTFDIVRVPLANPTAMRYRPPKAQLINNRIPVIIRIPPGTPRSTSCVSRPPSARHRS